MLNSSNASWYWSVYPKRTPNSFVSKTVAFALNTIAQCIRASPKWYLYARWQTPASIDDNPMPYGFVTSEMPQSNTLFVWASVFLIWLLQISFVLGAARWSEKTAYLMSDKAVCCPMCRQQQSKSNNFWPLILIHSEHFYGSISFFLHIDLQCQSFRTCIEHRWRWKNTNIWCQTHELIFSSNFTESKLVCAIFEFGR